MRPKLTDRPIYIDIDGTLTTAPTTKWGDLVPGRVEEVQRLIAQGFQVVLWSGGGTEYVRAFAERYGLGAAVCIGKPECCVDDNPTIRPNFGDRIFSPSEFFDDA